MILMNKLNNRKEGTKKKKFDLSLIKLEFTKHSMEESIRMISNPGISTAIGYCLLLQ